MVRKEKYLKQKSIILEVFLYNFAKKGHNLEPESCAQNLCTRGRGKGHTYKPNAIWK
jgi:hypothetical protein